MRLETYAESNFRFTRREMYQSLEIMGTLGGIRTGTVTKHAVMFMFAASVIDPGLLLPAHGGFVCLDMSNRVS